MRSKRSRRSEILFAAAAVLLLSAGLVTGMLVSRLQAAADAAAREPLPVRASLAGSSSPLIQALDLTPAQREQMRVIWDGVHGDVQSSYRDAQEIQKRREEALLSLLNGEQRAQFERLTRDYAQQYVALVARRERMFDTAVARTQQLLTPEQRKTYSTILHNRLGRVPTRAAAPTTEPGGALPAGG